VGNISSVTKKPSTKILPRHKADQIIHQNQSRQEGERRMQENGQRIREEDPVAIRLLDPRVIHGISSF
jgi:hypothetical protein